MSTMISKHFSEEECKCKDNCGFNRPTQKLLDLAEEVREFLGEPMIVHCACRCKKHNKEVGGASNSQHTYGNAMDFHCKNKTPKEIYYSLLEAKKKGKFKTLNGLFLYSWGVHIDCRNDSFRCKIM